jgi:hypothetical protein
VIDSPLKHAKFVGIHSGCGGPVFHIPGSRPCCAWCGKLEPRMPKKLHNGPQTA